ncbi:hypothetical protein H0H87_007299 [Tephrocybe sp. NHM501043]|nr:hypothetical protein H0H87_007299 [Tephrocybe sp. NHM501043]
MGSHTGTDYPEFLLTSVDSSQGGWAGTGYDHPSGYSPSSVSEEISSDGQPDDEGDEAYTAVRKGKKRRRGSNIADDDTRKARKTARRRGPGKAPKGAKSKKGPTTGRSETSTSHPPDRGSGIMLEPHARGRSLVGQRDGERAEHTAGQSTRRKDTDGVANRNRDGDAD